MSSHSDALSKKLGVVDNLLLDYVGLLQVVVVAVHLDNFFGMMGKGDQHRGVTVTLS